LTASTKSSHHSHQGVEALPTGLSFTQQLQQCTRSRHRPISKLLSPLSEPLSPFHSPPLSPLSETQSNRLSPIPQLSSPMSPSGGIITNPRGFMEPVHPRLVPPLIKVQEVHLHAMPNLRSLETKLKRNGIVTNPNVKSSSITAAKPPSAAATSVTSSIWTPKEATHMEPRWKHGFEQAPTRPSGLPLKKETPL
jgi:hypothetical protein